MAALLAIHSGALMQYRPWTDRREPFLATEDNGEPLEKDLVKQYFRDWVGAKDCPWYVREQYFQHNGSPARGVTTAAGQKDKKRPQVPAWGG